MINSSMIPCKVIVIVIVAFDLNELIITLTLSPAWRILSFDYNILFTQNHIPVNPHAQVNSSFS